MKLLFTIPHFFDGRRSSDDVKPGKYGSETETIANRLDSLCRAVYSLHQTFGASQAMIRHADRRTESANANTKNEVHIVIVINRDAHLKSEANFGESICQWVSVDDNPMHLGFHCHNVLRDRWGNYDYYGYLEDDLILHDAWLFEKLRWFNGHVGDHKVLLPNRFERSNDLAYKKCCLDGDLAERVASSFQDHTVEPELSSTVMGKAIRFVRPRNPHSGCFFLNANQMKSWVRQDDFGRPASDFVGPLESAASLGVMKAFQVYKPAVENANFLEVEHAGTRFLNLVRMPKSDP